MKDTMSTTGPAQRPQRQPQQREIAQRPIPQKQQGERPPPPLDAEDDPASDANTESANHPNDDE